jgi:hypothetical protein
MVLNFLSVYGSLENLRRDLNGQFDGYHKKRGYGKEYPPRKTSI